MKTRFDIPNWVESFNGGIIPMFEYEPNPDSSHDNFYYNTIENRLYKLVEKYDNKRKIKYKYWIAIVEEY